MLVEQVVNPLFDSNTYIISEREYDWVWLVDAGNVEDVFNQLPEWKIIKGVFITHAHFDHIYGLNKIFKLFPDCEVFTSEYGKEGLFSDKINLSFYHEDPIVFKGSKIRILHEKDRIELFKNCFLETFETPGHNWGSLTFKVNNYLFTGDSYIPEYDVVTKLKGGDKEASKKSLKKIKSLISENTIICPGHKKMQKIILGD